MFTDHSFLIEYLKRTGYIVYPIEIRCGLHETPHYPYRWVDVAAYKGGKFYAFEYKSSGDPICGAVKQIENYRKTFDYVILLVEVPRKGRSDVSLTLKRGKRIYKIIGLGAGIWIVSRNRSNMRCAIQEIVRPKPQFPNPINRKYIEKAFRTYSWNDGMIQAAFQRAR